MSFIVEMDHVREGWLDWIELSFIRRSEGGTGHTAAGDAAEAELEDGAAEVATQAGLITLDGFVVLGGAQQHDYDGIPTYGCSRHVATSTIPALTVTEVSSPSSVPNSMIMAASPPTAAAAISPPSTIPAPSLGRTTTSPTGRPR
jgi:hypothetical protein